MRIKQREILSSCKKRERRRSSATSSECAAAGRQKIRCDCALKIGIGISRKKSYDKLQELSSSPQMNAAVNNSALVYPASITVIRKSSLVGSVIPYKVYLNGSYIGDVKNGKAIQFQTSVSHNIVSMFDNYGNAFKDDAVFELSGGNNAEVHVRAGKLLTNQTKA